MTWQFGRIQLQHTDYEIELDYQLLNPVPVDQVRRVYREYCLHKRFLSVIPMVDGRITDPNTQLIGYHEQDRLVAWSMYRIWDNKNILSDHFAWDYRNPLLRLGIRSLQNECAIYRESGYEYMYFESIQPYMLSMQGFEILGPIG